MNPKKGLVLLTALFTYAATNTCHTPKTETGPVTTITFHNKAKVTIDHKIRKKEGIDLRCEDVAKINATDFTFYACEEDINFKLISKLEYIARVKKYGKEKLRLKQTKNYRVYKNNRDEIPKTRYRLYVTGKFELPQKWDNYQDIGEDSLHISDIKKPIIFWSTVDKLLDEKEHYSRQGYDVYWRSYSSFGGGSNASPDFLERSKARQASTVLHEDFHVTAKQELEIEESLATLIGRAGAVDFTGRYFGKDSKEHKEAKERLLFWLKFSKEISECNSRLLELYAKNISPKKKIAEKKKIMNRSRYCVNNASIWNQLPYTKNFPLAYEIYKKYPDMEELAEILVSAPKKERAVIEYFKLLLLEQ